MPEISTKPYLIRAIYEWCSDNGYKPYIAVAVDEHTHVPHEFVKNGEIVLNLSASATNHLRIGNDRIEFQARFNRVARELSIPIENVIAIYASESGHGMAFEVPNAAPRPTPTVGRSPPRGEASGDASPGEPQHGARAADGPATGTVVELSRAPGKAGRPRARPVAPSRDDEAGETAEAKPAPLSLVGQDAETSAPKRVSPDDSPPPASAEGRDDPDGPDDPPGSPKPRLTRVK